MPEAARTTDERLMTIKMAESIEGWLTIDDGVLLYDLARSPSADGVILEIGSWKGKSTVYLARGSKGGGGDLVYAVDHHRGSAEHFSSLGKIDTEAEFRRNLERASVSEVVVPLVMSSREAASVWSKHPAPIRLLWIDGSHDYSSVTEDIELWNRFLVDGGVIAFHDFTHYPEIRRAVRERIICSISFAEVDLHGSILLARKRMTAGPLQVFRNVFACILLIWIKPLAWRLICRRRRLIGAARSLDWILSHRRWKL